MCEEDGLVIDSGTRTNCKICRLEKCLKIGMKPEKVDRVGGGHEKATTSVEIAEEAFLDDEVEDVEVTVSKAPSSESPSSERELLSESYEILDMGSLVEDCVVEANLETNHVRCNQNNNFISEQIIEVMFEVAETMEATSPNITLPNEPVFNFTLEEEFKTYELLTRKDSLVDAMFGIKFEIPQFKTGFLNILSPGEFGCKGEKENTKVKQEGFQTLQTVFGINLNPGGKIRACLDMFDEYKHVDEEVKYETFDFSLKLLQLCSR